MDSGAAPIEGCDGKGFGFDIFPIDPDYRDENGDKMWSDDDEDDASDDDWSDEDEVVDESFDEKPASNDGGVNGIHPDDDPIDEDDIPF
jgi:hypothetical protein